VIGGIVTLTPVLSYRPGRRRIGEDGSPGSVPDALEVTA